MMKISSACLIWKTIQYFLGRKACIKAHRLYYCFPSVGRVLLTIINICSGNSNVFSKGKEGSPITLAKRVSHLTIAHLPRLECTRKKYKEYRYNTLAKLHTKLRYRNKTRPAKRLEAYAVPSKVPCGGSLSART